MRNPKSLVRGRPRLPGRPRRPDIAHFFRRKGPKCRLPGVYDGPMRGDGRLVGKNSRFMDGGGRCAGDVDGGRRTGRLGGRGAREIDGDGGRRINDPQDTRL